MRLAHAPIGYCTVALITTATGKTVLVDTGVHQTREAINTALRSRGLTPLDIDYVVLTHLHFDHCENVHQFDNAEVIVHEQEINEARAHPDRDRYLADFWQELLTQCRVRVMNETILELVDSVRNHH